MRDLIVVVVARDEADNEEEPSSRRGSESSGCADIGVEGSSAFGSETDDFFIGTR